MNDNNRGVRRIVILAVVVGIFLGLWHFGIIGKSDEEKIKDRLDQFVASYNNGDFEGILECIEPARRKQYEAATNLIGGIGSSLIGFNFSVSDLVGLGAMLMPEEARLSFEITRISILDGGRAVVYICNADGEGKISMVKHGRDWYLADIN